MTLPAPLRASLLRLDGLWPAVVRIARQQPHWLVLLVAYASAWYLPASLLWRLLRPGIPIPEGIDGPVSWSSRWWTNPASPLCYQPLVPLGVLLLAWDRRESLESLRRQTLQAERYLARQWRIGAVGWLAAGCALLAGAHLVHVATLAILGLQLIGVGIVRREYGPLVLRGLRIPLLFFALMTMPPETVPAKIQDKMAIVMAQSASGLLRLARQPVSAEGWTLNHSDVPLTVTSAGSGAALVTLTLVAVLWHGLWTRRNAETIVARMALGAVLAVGTNLFKTVLAGAVCHTSMGLARGLVDTPPWLLLPVTLAGVWLLQRVGGRLAPGLPARVRARLRPVARAIARPTDRLLDGSGRVLGATSGRVARASHGTMDQTARTIGKVLGAPIRLLGRSAQSIEGLFKRIEKQRRRKSPRR